MTISCPKCGADSPADSTFCRHCTAPLPAQGISGEADPTLTAPTDLPGLTTGSVFAGRYQVIETLGQGGMGRVYKVLDTRVGERIALKVIRSDMGADPQVARRFRKYVALSPRDANPVDSLAELEFRAGRLGEAAAGYRRASEIDPAFGADVRLAEIQAVQEDYGAALQTLSLWLPGAPSDTARSQTHGVRSVVLHLIGRRDESREALRTARRLLTPVHSEYLTDGLEGWLELDSGAFEASDSAFRRWNEQIVQLYGDQPGQHVAFELSRGYVAVERGDIGAAETLMESASKMLRTLSPREQTDYALFAGRLRARILLAKGDADGALAILGPAWPGPIPMLIPTIYVTYCFPFQQDDLARIHTRKGDWDRAIAEYRRLIEIGPEHRNRRLIHPLYHYRLAQVYEKTGARADAAAEYRRFLELWRDAAPGCPEVSDAHRRLEVLTAKEADLRDSTGRSHAPLRSGPQSARVTSRSRPADATPI